MRNLPSQITHSISFLSKYKQDSLKILSISESVYLEILSEVGYEQIRNKVKDYKKKMETEYFSDDLHEFKIFMEDLHDIKAKKNNESVIYSLRTFATNEREYKEIMKKKVKKFKEKLEDEELEAKRNENYVLYVGLKGISMYIDKLSSNLSKIIDSLNGITNLMDEKDDD